MKKITCISFHGTGSGAVDDYLKEFDNCASAPSDIECRFLQDPDGVSDLEYNLIENPHRLNSGYAIKRFLIYAKSMNRSYKKIFGDKWLTYTEKYAKSLITDTYAGYWHCDIFLLPFFQKYTYLFRRGLNKVLPKKFRKPGYYNYLPNLKYFHTSITEDDFLNKTKDYVDALCTLLNPSNKEFVLLDQALATSNINRYMKYVRDLKVIVVDRDPRDLYIQQILVGDHVLPQEAKTFAKVYRDQREIAKKSENPNILYIQFEDLIYNYEDTTRQIDNFLEQDDSHHVNKKKRFDPSVSIKNTQLWKIHSQFKNDISIIEEMLPEYLYDFKE